MKWILFPALLFCYLHASANEFESLHKGIYTGKLGGRDVTVVIQLKKRVISGVDAPQAFYYSAAQAGRVMLIVTEESDKHINLIEYHDLKDDDPGNDHSSEPVVAARWQLKRVNGKPRRLVGTRIRPGKGQTKNKTKNKTEKLVLLYRPLPAYTDTSSMNKWVNNPFFGPVGRVCKRFENRFSPTPKEIKILFGKSPKLKKTGANEDVGEPTTVHEYSAGNSQIIMGYIRADFESAAASRQKPGVDGSTPILLGVTIGNRQVERQLSKKLGIKPLLGKSKTEIQAMLGGARRGNRARQEYLCEEMEGCCHYPQSFLVFSYDKNNRVSSWEYNHYQGY